MEKEVYEIKETPIHIKGAEERREDIPKREGYEWLGGLKFGVSSTFVGQYASNTDLAGEEGGDQTDGSYSLDLEIEKEFNDWGLAFLHLETGDGAGVDRNYSMFSQLNRDADDSGDLLTLTELWYEHYLFDGQVTLGFGKLDPTCYVDQNEIANDETAQFLGHMFRNSPVIEFPDNHLGVRTTITPDIAPWMEIDAGFIDGDGNGDDLTDHGFIYSQINFKPLFLGEEYPGNYRFYYWRNDTNHSSYLNPRKNWEAGDGFGISIDQQIFDGVTLFSRFGWQDKEVYMLETAWSIGSQIDGMHWGREEDYFGIAFGQAIPGGDYKNENTLIDGITRNAGNEEHLELYYAFKANDHITISPDLQIVWDPNGGDGALTKSYAIIAGARIQLDF